MGEDKLRPGQRGVIQRFPGTTGDFRPTDKDVEGHAAPSDRNVPQPDGVGGDGTVRDIEGEDDVEGHRAGVSDVGDAQPDELYRPGGERGE